VKNTATVYLIIKENIKMPWIFGGKKKITNLQQANIISIVKCLASGVANSRQAQGQI
jgi:hypothetical protein